MMTIILLGIGLIITVVGLTLLSGGPDSAPALALNRVVATIGKRAPSGRGGAGHRRGRKHRTASLQERVGWLLIALGAVIAAFGIFR